MYILYKRKNFSNKFPFTFWPNKGRRQAPPKSIWKLFFSIRISI